MRTVSTALEYVYKGLYTHNSYSKLNLPGSYVLFIIAISSSHAPVTICDSCSYTLSMEFGSCFSSFICYLNGVFTSVSTQVVSFSPAYPILVIALRQHWYWW